MIVAGVMVVIFALAAGVLTALLLAWDGTDDRANTIERPSDWPAPSPTEARATMDFLADEGSDLERLLDDLTTVMGVSDDEQCPELTRVVGQAVEPTAALVTASAIPDPVFEELTITLRTTIADALSACHDTSDSGLQVLETTLAAALLRLAEIEGAA